MALRHWWPLNGTLEDKIGGNHLHFPVINNVNYNQGYIISDNSGKTGSCYARTAVAQKDFLRTINTIGPFAEESLCGWFLVTQHAATGTANGLVTHHNHATSSGLGIGVFTSDGTNYYTSVNAGTGSSRIHSSADYRGTTDIKGEWHHICLTYANGVIRMYVDGVEEAMNKNDYALYNTADYLDLFNWSTGYYTQTNYRPICKINDVRVYDHALSALEVKELAKGLVLHYNFDNPFEEPTVNLSKPSEWSHYTSYWTPIETTSSGWKVKKTSMTTSETIAISNSTIYGQMAVGDVWTISCYLYKNGEPFKTSSTIFSNWMGTLTTLSSEKRDDGYFSSTFRIDVLTRAYLIHAPIFGAISTISEDDVFEIRNLQVEKKSHATPYTPSSRDLSVSDSSGFGNDGENLGIEIITDADCPSGSLVGKFTSGKYIKVPNPFKARFSQATWSFWLKETTGNNSYKSIFNSLGSPTGTYWISVNTESQGLWFYSGGYIRGTATFSSNVYHHIVLTYNAGTFQWYIDGAKTGMSTTISPATLNVSEYMALGDSYTGTSWGGTPFEGTIADFRIYATPLTEAEIIEMYRTKSYLYEEGDFFAHEFVEDSNEQLIEKNYRVRAKQFQEVSPEVYEFIEYIQSSGTQYIDTGYYWQSEKATIIADMMVTATQKSETAFGAEEGYTDPYSSGSRYFAHILHDGGGSGSFANYIGTGSRGTSTSLPVNNRYLVEYITHGDNTFTTRRTATDGTVTTFNNKVAYTGTILVRQNSKQTLANRGHIFIFSNHNSYNGSGPIQPMKGMRLYRFVMIDNDEYVRDFRPCIRKSDSVAGLLDLVTGEFYTTPAGTFTAGSAISVDTTTKFLIDGQIQLNQIIEI